jgi:hypothetical protein
MAQARASVDKKEVGQSCHNVVNTELALTNLWRDTI